MELVSTVLAIDPGNTESAYVLLDAATRRPIMFDKVPNEQLRAMAARADFRHAGSVAIEMVASYGMPVGAEVFETCVAIGRFLELIPHAELVKRAPVKLHHCRSSRAKDSNVRQALVDRFAPGQSNHGKGTKATPGWFYGFRADVWQAYALAVYVADTIEQGEQISA